MNKQVLGCVVCGLLCQYTLLSVEPAVVLRDLGSNTAEASILGLLPLIQSVNIPLPHVDCSTKFKTSDGAFIGNILYPDGWVNKHQTIDYRFMLPVLKLVYTRIKATNAAHANTMSEIKKLQVGMDVSNKQTTAQMQGLEQRLDRLILCNTKLIEFLAQKDHTIASTQDALTLVDKSKQLLEEELISKNERIAFLEDALKSLKEKMEDLAIENESIRAELEASIQGLQLKLKQ